MEIKHIRRPWQNKKQSKSYGDRLTKDPFYQSSLWKHTKRVFKQGFSTLPNGDKVSNMLCYECMARDNRVVPMHSVDHIIPIEEGGDRTDHNNLRSLCLSDHNSKSAIEGNNRRKKR